MNRISGRLCARLAIAFLSVVASALLVSAQQAPPIVDPKADAILKQMSQAVGASQSLSFTAVTLTDEVTPTGQKIQYSKRSAISVRRPNGVHSLTRGDRENFTAIYDGKTFTLYDPTANEYAVVPMPPTIDAAVDTLAEKYGLVAPLADMLFSNPYESFMMNVQAGVYLGEHDVNGVACHHLAFRQAGADWQIWIESGARPLPRKLVITYKTIPGEPQFIAFLNDWNLSASLSPDLFNFTPPSGAKRIELPALPAPTTAPVR
jgi:hypothetical protein